MSSQALEMMDLVHAIVCELEEPRDLVSLACVARRFRDVALRKAWTCPVFDGAPLVTMTALFPEGVSQRLLESEDPSLLVSPQDFERFDYYAQFIRRLCLWQHGREEYIAGVLRRSRPGSWLFPCLEYLHMGASGESIEIAGAYLTPTVRTLKLNHWALDSEIVVQPSRAVRSSLLQIFRLPVLEHLDLLDTRYPTYERDAEVISSLTKLLPQLRTFRSYDFTLLDVILPILSQSQNIEEVFLDLTNLVDGHLTIGAVSAHMRAFPSLHKLGLLGTSGAAAGLLKAINRPLEEIDLRIDSAVQAQDLQQITHSIFSESPSLYSFRCSSASALECGLDPPIRIGECLEPLRKFFQLRDLYISMSFSGQQVVRDEEIFGFFRAWPRLETCIIECDPDDESVPDETDAISYGLTLQAIVAAARHCPHLRELSLPYVDSRSIPAVEPAVPKSSFPLELHLARSHVHDRAIFGAFIATLWPNAEISLDGCCDLSSIEYRASNPPTIDLRAPAAELSVDVER